MALAAENANDRARQMITLSDRLSGLLARETELFLARTPQLVAKFSDEKSNLARIYRTEITRIGRDPSLLADADTQIKTDLRAATVKFNQALDANHSATNAIAKITEGMVKSVANEVASKRTAQSGYGANGNNVANAAAASAITLDQRV